VWLELSELTPWRRSIRSIRRTRNTTPVVGMKATMAVHHLLLEACILEAAMVIAMVMAMVNIIGIIREAEAGVLAQAAAPIATRVLGEFSKLVEGLARPYHKTLGGF